MKSRSKNVLKNVLKNSKKKYILTLTNIDTDKVDQKFGISLISNINMISTIPKNTTKLSQLNVTQNTPEIISFIDEAKKQHKCSVSMIDFNTHKELSFDGYDEKYHCFWCRNKIPSHVIPIGCPIRFVPSQAVKTYYSEISKSVYTIKENITSYKKNKLKQNKNIVIDEKEKYITDGIFCSFNCCMSYITDNKNNSFYSMSEMLLLKMYNDINPDKVPRIQEAAHWRILKQYGGHLTIEQFRKSFSKIEYKVHGTVNIEKKFKSLGVLFEEKLKF